MSSVQEIKTTITQAVLGYLHKTLDLTSFMNLIDDIRIKSQKVSTPEIEEYLEELSLIDKHTHPAFTYNILIDVLRKVTMT